MKKCAGGFPPSRSTRNAAFPATRSALFKTVTEVGAHIFHIDDKKIWDYVNRFAEFNRYTNCPVVNYKDHLYNLPFNMNTFAKIWPTVITPEDAKSHIEEQSSVMAGKSPQNLEEQAISLVGRDIYKILVKGYTEKQWGRDCVDLPPTS